MTTQLHNQNKPFAGATLRKESVDKPLVNGSFIVESLDISEFNSVTIEKDKW